MKRMVGTNDRTKGRGKAITGIGDVPFRGLEREVYDATDPLILDLGRIEDGGAYVALVEDQRS